MLPTTWHGRARVMYLPARTSVDVRLVTAQPLVVGEVRPGLTVGFVGSSRPAPPSWVRAELADGAVSTDVRNLLGERLSAAADEAIAGNAGVRWARLDLAAVDRLAAAWAPYRAHVLAGAVAAAEDEEVAAPAGSAVGRWERNLWARLSVDDVLTALRVLLGPSAPQATTGEQSPFADQLSDPGDAPVTGTWTLPVELASAAGVAPDVGWTLEQRDAGTVLALRATQVRADDVDDLLVSVDHATASWVPFTRDPAAADVLVAELSSGAVSGAAGLRLRSRSGDPSGEGGPTS